MAPPTPTRLPDIDRKPTCHVQLYQMHPGEAAGWIGKGMYERQRPLRRHHVDFLAHLMAFGRFRDGSGIDLAQLGQRQVVINGQHTLHAIVQSEQAQWVTFTVHHCESEAEIAQLYNTFDRQMPRNARDMLKAHGFMETQALSARHSLMLVSAVRMVLSGLAHYAARGNPRQGYMNDQELLYVAALQWVKEARLFYDAVAGVNHTWSRYLIRQPLAAVGFILMRYQPEKATEFWRAVAREDHPKPDHITRQYARVLQREGLKSSYNRDAYVRMTAAAWDAFYHDRPVRQLNMQDAGYPPSLAGTPHTHSTTRRYVDAQWHLLREPLPYAEPLYEKGA